MPSRSDPTIIVNDIPYSYVPGSLEHNFGLGEETVDSATGGNGAVETIITVNAETKVSEIKFKMFTTTENEEAYKLWKSTPGKNTVVEEETGLKPITGTKMTCISNPMWAVGPSGQVEMMFKGAPLT